MICLLKTISQDIKGFRRSRTAFSELSYAKKRVDKLAAHLTYHRSRYNKKKLNHGNMENFTPKYIKQLKLFMNHYQIHLKIGIIFEN